MLARMRLALVLLLLWPVSAFAQESAGDGAEQGQDTTVTLYKRAQRAYQAGDFAAATRLLEAATELAPNEPVLRYNLGRAYERSGNREAAADAYSKYLELSPDAADRGAVEADIARLERNDTPDEPADGELQDLVDPGGPEPPQEEDPGSRSVAGPVVLLGVGIVAGAATVGLGLRSNALEDEAPNLESHEAASEQYRKAERQAVAANILGAAAGALVTVGLIWLIVRLSGGDEDAAEAVRTRGSLRF